MILEKRDSSSFFFEFLLGLDLCFLRLFGPVGGTTFGVGGFFGTVGTTFDVGLAFAGAGGGLQRHGQAGNGGALAHGAGRRYGPAAQQAAGTARALGNGGR